MIYMHLLTWVGFGLIVYVLNTLYKYLTVVGRFMFSLYTIEVGRILLHTNLFIVGIEPVITCLVSEESNTMPNRLP
jgi:hypothetical protein